MIVCHCNALSDHKVRSTVARMLAADSGSAITSGRVIRELGVRRQCSGCTRTLSEMIDDCCRACGGDVCQRELVLSD